MSNCRVAVLYRTFNPNQLNIFKTTLRPDWGLARPQKENWPCFAISKHLGKLIAVYSCNMYWSPLENMGMHE